MKFCVFITLTFIWMFFKIGSYMNVLGRIFLRAVRMDGLRFLLWDVEELMFLKEPKKIVVQVLFMKKGNIDIFFKIRTYDWLPGLIKQNFKNRTLSRHGLTRSRLFVELVYKTNILSFIRTFLIGGFLKYISLKTSNVLHFFIIAWIWHLYILIYYYL